MDGSITIAVVVDKQKLCVPRTYTFSQVIIHKRVKEFFYCHNNAVQSFSRAFLAGIWQKLFCYGLSNRQQITSVKFLLLQSRYPVARPHNQDSDTQNTILRNIDQFCSDLICLFAKMPGPGGAGPLSFQLENRNTKAHQTSLLEEHRLWHIEVTSLPLYFGLFPSSSFLYCHTEFKEITEQDHII